MKKYAAFLREKSSLREIAVTDAGKPAIDQAFIKRWKSVFNLVATQADEPVVVILQVMEDALYILFQSNEKNQNDISKHVQNGLYCDSATGGSGLLLTKMTKRESQNGNPFDLGSVTVCFGLPIQWPDGMLFGVVCVLNHSGKALKASYRNTLKSIQELLEDELEALLIRQQPQEPVQPPAPPAAPVQKETVAQPVVQQMQPQEPVDTETDALTDIYSRKKIEDILKHEFDRAKRYFKTFSVTMIDLNGLLKAKVSMGEAGDAVRKAFAQSVAVRIRETDSWGRWEDDIFVLVCPYADTVETQQMVIRIKPLVDQEMKAIQASADFSFGVSQYEPEDLTYQAIVNRAEENMYRYEEMMKRKAAELMDD